MRTIVPSGHSANDRAKDIPHSGIRVCEIIAYRAWRVIDDAWSEKDQERLHSMAMWDYVWHPDKPASGDVRTHGIYSSPPICRRRACTADAVGPGARLGRWHDGDRGEVVSVEPRCPTFG